MFWSFGEMRHRLGPLAVEQKKRAVGKRAKFEKNKADERRPQELREEDIARSENETTKHVIDVIKSLPFASSNRLLWRVLHLSFFRFKICSWSRMAPSTFSDSSSTRTTLRNPLRTCFISHF